MAHLSEFSQICLACAGALSAWRWVRPAPWLVHEARVARIGIDAIKAHDLASLDSLSAMDLAEEPARELRWQRRVSAAGACVAAAGLASPSFVHVMSLVGGSATPLLLTAAAVFGAVQGRLHRADSPRAGHWIARSELVELEDAVAAPSTSTKPRPSRI